MRCVARLCYTVYTLYSCAPGMLQWLWSGEMVCVWKGLNSRDWILSGETGVSWPRSVDSKSLLTHSYKVNVTCTGSVNV